MGMFASIRIDESIDLPYFPEELDHTDYGWQSKRGIDVYNGPYKLTEDGRLKREEKIWTEKTDEEKQAEAEKWGFDSWDEYTSVYEGGWSIDEDGIIPDAVDWDSDEDGYEDMPPTFAGPSDETVKKTIWLDCNKHGTVEFYTRITEGVISTIEEEKPLSTDDGETREVVEEWALNIFVEYEARFDRGGLTDIVFMGDRHQNTDDPIGDVLEQINKWKEWKEKQRGDSNE
jgi:hypothetical protein